MATRRYLTANAFRVALEARLRARGKELGIDQQRFRFLVVFERFLARLTHLHPDWALKGGYAMELRVGRARTTKDIDLSLRDFRSVPASSPERDLAIRASLQEAAALDLEDFFVFRVGGARATLDAAPYGGTSFPVDASLDGRLFQRFSVDVAVGDPPAGHCDELSGGDWLAFAGISAPKFLTISQEQQMAEKVHAYTLPREGTPNTRVKDLVDMLLLIRRGELNEERLASTLRDTFARRARHRLPMTIAPPPPDWDRPFAAYAVECRIEEDVQSAFMVTRTYLEPLLQAAADPRA